MYLIHPVQTFILNSAKVKKKALIHLCIRSLHDMKNSRDDSEVVMIRWEKSRKFLFRDWRNYHSL